MFGPLPANFDPTKSPAEVARNGGGKSEKELSQEQEKVKSAIRFSVINVTPEGDTAIGFTDNSDAKKPVHYYLKVGEARNGWLVKEADAKTATMTIEKDGVEVTLSLGGDSASGDGKTEKNTPVAHAASPAALKSPILSQTLGSKRRLLREAEARRNEEERKKLADERAKLEAEREQREAERQKEREETRATLQQLQEELRRQREQKTQDASRAQGDGNAPSEGEAEGNDQS